MERNEWRIATEDLETVLITSPDFPWLEAHYRTEDDGNVHCCVCKSADLVEELSLGNYFGVRAIIPKGAKWKFSDDRRMVVSHFLSIPDFTFTPLTREQMDEIDNSFYKKVCADVLRMVGEWETGVCVGYIYTADNTFVHPAALNDSVKFAGVVVDVDNGKAYVACLPTYMMPRFEDDGETVTCAYLAAMLHCDMTQANKEPFKVVDL